MLSLLVIACLSYLVGSFPTSIVLGRLVGNLDIREHGSKNAGGTNAMRVLGLKIGLIVAVVDVAKGVLATLLLAGIRFGEVPVSHDMVQVLAGTCAVIGHIWTIFAGFKGGKGVATASGVLFSLYPWAGAVCLVIFATIIWTTRYVSLGSLSVAALLPLCLLVWNQVAEPTVSSSFLFFSLLMGGLICFTHRTNIKRLLNGTENRLKKKSP